MFFFFQFRPLQVLVHAATVMWQQQLPRPYQQIMFLF